MMGSKKIIFSFLLASICLSLFAKNPPRTPGDSNPSPNTDNTSLAINFRADCLPAVKQIDMEINNVRARLITGGDVWWDFQDGKYIVPKPPVGSNLKEVSSIFAGAVWIGGQDPTGNLKIAAQTYRGGNGASVDFYAGPLDPITGTTDMDTCVNWDRFFRVYGAEIEKVDALFKTEKLEVDLIPENVLYWPGKGNPYFTEKFPFELPDASQGLGSFWDEDQDGRYDPLQGDIPIIEIRGCEPNFRSEAIELLPDEMTFWIYNDAGGVHAETMGAPIQMEIQVQAFAYATNDEINDMTFQRYKLINRADADIRDCYFAMWVDPDLGCSIDDYVGCDVERSLAYTYNEDALDGNPGIDCDAGIATYEDVVPIIGTDYFRGPLGPKNIEFDESGDTIYVNPPVGSAEFDTIIELGMSSFGYYNRSGEGSPPQTEDPQTADHYYNYIRGLWRDGTAVTFGGSGYNPGSMDSVRYTFPSVPNEQSGWSMCTAGLPFGDRRTLQASGPFLLKPGAVNELIIGAVWVPDLTYPCPDISRLQVADDLAQGLFDNCFDIIDGPDAPDLCPIELDQQVILILSNDSIESNNALGQYSEIDILAPEFIDEDERSYKFEGYKIYQLINPLVTAQQFNDIENSRIVRQVDVQNGVTDIFNWKSDRFPGVLDNLWTFERKVKGADQGIRLTVQITEDQFASGDRRLINHKKYYFAVVAYAHNEWAPFDPTQDLGQRTPYLEGRKNIKIYTVIPRPIVYQNINAEYGDGAIVSRLSGQGIGGEQVELEEGLHEAIIEASDGEGNTYEGDLIYKPGLGPIEINIYDPLRVKDGKYRLKIFGEHDSGVSCSLKPGATWELTDVQTGEVIISENTIDNLNEQIITDLGFSIAIGQTTDAGANQDETNGVIGGSIEYDNPASALWFGSIGDDARGFQLPLFLRQLFNFLKTGDGEKENSIDPNQAYSDVAGGAFAPYFLSSSAGTQDGDIPFYLTPAWNESVNISSFSQSNNGLSKLNNVDIVFSPNKDEWSRCVVVETANRFNILDAATVGATTIEDASMFDLRQSNSIDKNGNEDGDGIGMGWFPGYAIDVESGDRLNIFYGENSIFSDENPEIVEQMNSPATGGDMLFNPTSEFINVDMGNIALNSSLDMVAGNHHFIYVTRTKYDKCEVIREQLGAASNLVGKINTTRAITWASIPLANEEEMLSYSEDYIPNRLEIRLRVDNPYNLVEDFDLSDPSGCSAQGELPEYEFEIIGREATDVVLEDGASALSEVNIVPNPYYGYSQYETSQNSTTVKVTNLPEKATVTIYTLDGKFVKQFRRDERPVVKAGNNPGVRTSQITPALEWNLKNSKNIPVASGVYLFHIVAPELGEEITLKWFGINRKFDPSGS